MAPRPLNELLSCATGTGSLILLTQKLGKLEQDVHSLLPISLTHAVKLASPLNGKLLLLVSNNAVAARLRQQTPSLIESLTKRGWLIRSISIRVNITSPVPLRPLKKTRLSRKGFVSLRNLRDELSPSPLRDAVTHLVAHHSHGGNQKS
ncbi:DciA family protein [Candidatus Pandoraea novymonadis]|nr:DciA family protein [Candidatus Pandoraea novymonadis]